MVDSKTKWLISGYAALLFIAVVAIMTNIQYTNIILMSIIYGLLTRLSML